MTAASQLTVQLARPPRPARASWLIREREYARATAAALVLGLGVRRRGDMLHLRLQGRWHALALVADPGPDPRWVHFDLDLHDWFALGGRRVRELPSASGWQAVRWLTASCTPAATCSPAAGSSGPPNRSPSASR